MQEVRTAIVQLFRQRPGNERTCLIGDTQHTLVGIPVRPKKPPFGVNEFRTSGSSSGVVEPVPMPSVAGRFLDLVPAVPVLPGCVLVVPLTTGLDPAVGLRTQ